MPVTLIRLTYEYARCETLNDKLLRVFFALRQISFNTPLGELIFATQYGLRLFTFVETLIENIFLPCKVNWIILIVESC